MKIDGVELEPTGIVYPIRDYDSNGNLIHEKCADGCESFYDYDSNGKLTHSKYVDGREYFYEYNSNGKMIHKKYADGGDGKLIYRKYVDGRYVIDNIEYKVKGA